MTLYRHLKPTQLLRSSLSKQVNQSSPLFGYEASWTPITLTVTFDLAQVRKYINQLHHSCDLASA